MSLIIDITVEDDYLKIKPIGEIDIYTSPKFKDEVIKYFKKNSKNILIDGEKLEYIDSTGLGALISIYKILKEEEKDIYIKNIKPNIKKLFEITDLNKIFTIKE